MSFVLESILHIPFYFDESCLNVCVESGFLKEGIETYQSYIVNNVQGVSLSDCDFGGIDQTLSEFLCCTLAPTKISVTSTIRNSDYCCSPSYPYNKHLHRIGFPHSHWYSPFQVATMAC